MVFNMEQIDKEKEQGQSTSTNQTSNFITDQELENVGLLIAFGSAHVKQSLEDVSPQTKTLLSLTLNRLTTTTTSPTSIPVQPSGELSSSPPVPSFSFRNPTISKAEHALLDKFENEVMKNEEAISSLQKLKIETRDKYLYQIKRYIRFCANTGLDNFLVTNQLAQQLIESEMMKRGGNISENTVRSIRSPLNKLYFMNKIVYGEQQQNEILGDQFIQQMLNSMMQKKNKPPNKGDKDEDSGEVDEKDEDDEADKGESSVRSKTSSRSGLLNFPDQNPSSNTSLKPSSSSTTMESSSKVDTTDLKRNKGKTPLTESNLEVVGQDRQNKESSSVSSSSVLVFNPNTNTKSFGLSGNSKHRLSQSEEALLRKFDEEILNNPKTQDILSNLTGNTFKSYATDIKRFIKYCARKGKLDFLIDEDILTRFLSFQTSKSSSSASSSSSGNSSGGSRTYNLKNTRTSLLKLHQLNCLAYDLEFSEGDIILTLNKFLDSTINAAPTNVLGEEQLDLTQELEPEGDPLLDQLQHYYQTSTILDGLSDQSKKLYANEFNRYALFCSQQGLSHFLLTGDLIKQYFIDEVIGHTPTISTKKLKEILSRLNRLHNLNIEIDPENTPKQIRNIHVVKDFINEYCLKAHSDSPAQGSAITVGGSSGNGGNGIGGSGTSSSSTSGSGSGNGNGADTLSGASTSGSSISSGLPHLNFSNNPTNILTGLLLLSSEQPSGGELSSSLRRSTTSQNPKSRLKSSFQSYSSRPEIIDTTSGGANTSSGGGGKEKAQKFGLGEEIGGSTQRLRIVDENKHMENMYESIDSEENIDEPKDQQIAAGADDCEHNQGKQDVKEQTLDYDYPQSSPPSSSSSKRQKLESLPETNDSIPKFVMNKGIESITQLVEEWTLIIKRNEKYGLAWIKTMNDLQLYNSRKLIIALMEEILPTMNEVYKGKKIGEIYLFGGPGDAGELVLFELALVFDQYLNRKSLTIDDLIKKIENYPSYVKLEFLRIISRRKSTTRTSNVVSGGGLSSSSASSVSGVNNPPS